MTVTIIYPYPLTLFRGSGTFIPGFIAERPASYSKFLSGSVSLALIADTMFCSLLMNSAAAQRSLPRIDSL